MKIVKKLKEHYFASCRYQHYYLHLSVNEKVILLESQHGGEYMGNIYYIIKELINNPQYVSYAVFLVVKKKKLKNAKCFYQKRGLQNIHYVEHYSREYFRLMASAKYLINDNTFLPFFVKKEGQVYLNTWHGTPLKTLGKRINDDFHNIGNAQKNFIAADYLLFPNFYTKKHIVEDYMLKNLCANTCLLSGYPRNTAFFDSSLRSEIRNNYSLNGKKVIAYMPTWRGTLTRKNKAVSEANLKFILSELDHRLESEYVVYVNLHPIELASIDFKQYKNIFAFPADYETYEFLASVDILITDYSSVLFDFLNTRKKIILYAYDREYYCSTRGLYRELDSFPFPVVERMDDLIKEINSPKQYDDSSLLEEFCVFDSETSTKLLCERLIFEKQTSRLQEETISGNAKKNILIYVGSLAQNGLTTSLRNLLNLIDTEKFNFVLLFETRSVLKHLSTLCDLVQQFDYYAMKGKMNLGIFQKILYYFYSNTNFISTSFYLKHLKDAYQVEIKRVFANAYIDTVVHFTGYSTKKINLFSQLPCNRVIFVHSDMLKEIETRHHQRFDALQYAYRTYDKVAVVTEDIIEPTVTISQKSDNIYVCHNLVDYKSVIERSGLPLQFDNLTVCYPSVGCVKHVLDSNALKIINVGRFSPEKGQLRLLDAFNRLKNQYPNVCLILVGGRGTSRYYKDVIQHIEKLGLHDSVAVIRELSNPFPLIKQCDYSILTSFYEGFGLVLVEADILGLPVVSVDISGPRTFMEKHGGLLVENSNEGILTGLRRCVQGEVPPLKVDYHQYNQVALEEFYNLITNVKDV